MDATKIDCKLASDEDKHIIISIEKKGLASHERERKSDHRCKKVIAIWTSRIDMGSAVVEAETVQWKEVRTGERGLPCCWVIFYWLQVGIDTLVDTGNICKPFIVEAIARIEHALARIEISLHIASEATSVANAHWCPIGT